MDPLIRIRTEISWIGNTGFRELANLLAFQPALLSVLTSLPPDQGQFTFFCLNF
jgi:hypothetical protein